MTGHPHSPARLYHYTCTHGAQGIRRDRIIKPASMLPGMSEETADTLVWLTDLCPPVASSWLGLTQHRLRCDRTSTVFVVEDLAHVVWYMRYRKRYPGLRVLEHEPGTQPMHWFVAPGPLPVVGEARPDGTVMPVCLPGKRR